MRRTALMIALVAALLLAPGVQACSFAEYPPEPAAVWVRDAATEREWRVRVQNRSLGAACQLTNPVAFDGQRIGVVDGPIRVVDLVNSTEERIEPEGDPGGISLADDSLLYWWGRSFPVRVHDLATGRERDVRVPGLGHVAGGLALTEGRKEDAYGVYDVLAGRWVARDVRVRNLDGDAHVEPIAFGRDWLIFRTRSQERDDIYAVWLATGVQRRLEPMSDPPSGTWRDGDWLYWSEGYSNVTIHRIHPGTEVTEEVVTDATYGQPTDIVDRYLFYTAYSEPPIEGSTGQPFEVRGPAPAPSTDVAAAPGTPGLILAALLVAGIAIRRAQD